MRRLKIGTWVSKLKRAPERGHSTRQVLGPEPGRAPRFLNLGEHSYAGGRGCRAQKLSSGESNFKKLH